MKLIVGIKTLALVLCLSELASAQFGRFMVPQQEAPEVPLMTPAEKKAVDEQSKGFNAAFESVFQEAAKSTVRIWGVPGRPRILAYGTVIGDGSQVLTKWSEIARHHEDLQVQAGEDMSFDAVVEGVYAEDDLAVLKVSRGAAPLPVNQSPLVPAKFEKVPLTLGTFLAAPQPSGAIGAFGVVGVLERSLRERDQAHLGILGDPNFAGEGVRISMVQPEYGAAEAGLKVGDTILKVEDQSIGGLQDLRNAISQKKPGDRVKLRIETAGAERDVEVRLSNRPVQGQFAGDRLNQMEIMGGDINETRSGFSRVVQTDMQIQAKQVGGPVVDLQGRIVGITLARADRTRTYIMSSAALADVLSGATDSVAEAQAKIAAKAEQLASQQRELIPKLLPQARPRDLGKMQQNLENLARLAQRLDEELELLEQDE